MPPTSLLRGRVPSRHRAAVAAPALLLAVLLLAGCGSSGPLTIGPDQNGQYVDASHGQHLTVTLPGSAWQFNLTPPFGPLTEVSVHLTGGHTSSASAVFVAGHKGTATITASRTRCGSGPCAPGQHPYTVHVQVSG